MLKLTLESYLLNKTGQGMLNISEKQSRQYLCCCSHVSASAGYFSTEITTFCLRIPISCCGDNYESRGKKKKEILGEDMKRGRRKIPGAAEMLCADFLIEKQEIRSK